MKIKIVSGGQTGADRGGLDAAIELGIPHGGFCPEGRKSEDGFIPIKYNLKELKGEPQYSNRTENNVMTSDLTIIFSQDFNSPGTKLTQKFCKNYNKPVFLYNIKNDNKNRLREFLDLFIPDKEAIVLNVAGNRESKAPGIQKKVKEIMIKELKEIEKYD